jgi:serine/threonine protein kinase
MTSGGQGWTATAVEKESGEVRVIKTVACENIKAGNKALKEAKILQTLQHPAVVRYMDVFLHREPSCQELLVCTVMEYCEGGDMAKRYFPCPMAADRALITYSRGFIKCTPACTCPAHCDGHERTTGYATQRYAVELLTKHSAANGSVRLLKALGTCTRAILYIAT